MKDKRPRDEDGKIKRITKTCKVVLEGPDGRIPMGDVKLTEIDPGPTIEQFADAAFKASRASLVRLMTPYYRIVVIEEDGAEAPYGLDRWIKLVDREKEYESRAMGKGSKQTIRKTG